MWILPQDLKESFLSAQGFAESNADLNVLASGFNQYVTWRGKHSSPKTWLVRWKRVPWLRRLFGRTLDPSMDGRFVEWWTASLEAIPAREKVLQESESSRTMKDSFGQLFEQLSRQLDLFGASSKTSMTTSQGLSDTFLRTYKIWVTQLRQEYSARRKSEHRMIDNDSSSSRLTPDFWLTPRATESPETAESYLKRMQASPDPKNNTKTRPGSLNSQVNWKTPGASETVGGTMPELLGDAKYKLRDQVNWETPQARDFRSPDLPESQNYQRKVEEGYTIDLNSQVMEEKNWTTPCANNTNQNTQFKQGGTALAVQVRNYPTPMARDYRNGHGVESERFQKRKAEAKRQGTGVNLVEFIQREENWPTPTFAGNNQGSLQEWGGSKNKFRGGHPDPDSDSTDGKSQELSRGRLNPKWVCQLMGFQYEKTFFVRSETQ